MFRSRLVTYEYLSVQVEANDLELDAFLRTIKEADLVPYTAKKKAIVTDEKLTKNEAEEDSGDLDPEKFAEICRKASIKVRCFA